MKRICRTTAVHSCEKSGKSSSLSILFVVQNICLLSIVFNSCIFRVILLRFKLNKCNCLRLQCSAVWTKEHVSFLIISFRVQPGILTSPGNKTIILPLRVIQFPTCSNIIPATPGLFHEWKFLKQSVVVLHVNVYTLNCIF